MPRHLTEPSKRQLSAIRQEIDTDLTARNALAATAPPIAFIQQPVDFTSIVFSILLHIKYNLRTKIGVIMDKTLGVPCGLPGMVRHKGGTCRCLISMHP